MCRVFFYQEAQMGLHNMWENHCQLHRVFGGLTGFLLPMLLMPPLVCIILGALQESEDHITEEKILAPLWMKEKCILPFTARTCLMKNL